MLFPGMAGGLNPSEVTIARLLGDAGYATQMVGKWHCGDQADFLPTRHGFDGWYGLPYSNDMGIQASKFTEEEIKKIKDEFGIELPSGAYPPLPLMLDEEVIEAQPDQAALTERYLQESIRFMRSNRDQPFFLYFAHMYVHLPLYVQPQFLAESRNGPYGAAVRCIDWALAVLMAELSALGLSDDTIVIFTSDNRCAVPPWRRQQRTVAGRQRHDLGRRHTSSLYCALAWPNTSRFDHQCAHHRYGSLSDDRRLVRRRCADLIERSMAAISMRYFGEDLPNLVGRRSCTTAVQPSKPSEWAPGNSTWSRNNKWRGGDSEEMPQLFDLATDVGETTNVLADNPEVVADIMVHVEAARAELGDAATGAEGTGRRQQGRVDNPVTLTTFDPDHPYYMAEYDLADRG